MARVRNPFLDFVKGILICLVIWGHMLEFTEGVVGGVFYHFIYFFHMPLFVLISGYLTKTVQSSREFLTRNIGLLETLIVFQVIFVLLAIIQGESFSWNRIVTPFWAMWYMLSLLWWRLLVSLINPSRYSIQLCVVCSLILCLLAGYLPVSYIFSFQRTFYFFPFFMIGHCLAIKRKSLQECRLSFNKSLFILTCAFGGCIYIVGFKDFSFASLLYGSYNYDITSGLLFNGGYKCLIVRCILILFSILVSFAFLSSIRKIRVCRWLVKVGEYSLFFYIYHIFAVCVFRIVSTIIGLPLSFPFILIYTIILFLILYVLSDSKIMVKLLNPITNFYKK